MQKKENRIRFVGSMIHANFGLPTFSASHTFLTSQTFPASPSSWSLLFLLTSHATLTSHYFSLSSYWSPTPFQSPLFFLPPTRFHPLLSSQAPTPSASTKYSNPLKVINMQVPYLINSASPWYVHAYFEQKQHPSRHPAVTRAPSYAHEYILALAVTPARTLIALYH